MTPALAVRLGRYELFDAIASGGMGTVYLARALDPRPGEAVVAIKRLHANRASDPQFVARFSREAKIATRVTHSNVVRTLDVGVADGELFVVREYLHGESLARLLRAAREKNEAVPHDIASAIVIGTLRGLHAAHEVRGERGEQVNLVHRDVSPENVLVGEDGVAHVLDFGIARTDDQTQTTVEGQMKGKLAYMAPELIDHEASRASDVYAAGVCLWEALTGQRLFSGDNESVVLAKVLAALVTRPSKIAPDISPELDALVMRALCRDPNARFQTAADMADALQAIVAPAGAARVAAWMRSLAGTALDERAQLVTALATKSSRKMPWPLIGALALVAFGIFAFAISSLHSRTIDTPITEVVASTPPASASAAASSPIAMPSSTSPPQAADIEIVDAPIPTATVPTSARPLKRPPKVDCTEPYVVDAQGMRHYKKACLK
ncbi:MAG: serine/threonine-protein kinase [Polyangiaceae bacterium]